MDFLRLFDILPYQEARYAKAVAFSRATAQGEKQYSSKEAVGLVQALSAALLEAGVVPGERVGMLCRDNQPLWHFHDFALQQIGAIVTPIHAAASDAEVTYILQDAQIQRCIVSDIELENRLRTLASDHLRQIWHLEGSAALPLHPVDEAARRRIQQLSDAIQDTDLATIIYTSGSTGEPKGVMLSHRNIVSNIKSIIALAPMDYTHRVFSFLPLSHIFERTVTYAYMAVGATIYYPEQAGTLMRDLRAARPHYFTAVPRVLEKFYAGIQAAAKHSALSRWIMAWALGLGRQYKTGKTFPPAFWIQLALADWLVFRHWRRALGGHIRGIMVGAAALSPQLGRLFSAARIHIREGYGLTESSPVVAFNRFDPGGVRFGTVGIPIPGVEVRIHEPDEQGEGEILVRGPNVMLGYLNRPEDTRAAIDAEGWLHTGDVGKFVYKRFLQITDRQKDLFKLSSGRYVAPQAVERALLESPYIENCLVCGADKPFTAALILPDFVQLEAWCHQNNVHWTAPQFMALHPKVLRFMEEEVERCCEPLPHHQRVKKFALLHESWTEQSGHLTPTLKLRRSHILKQYERTLKELYQGK